MDLKDFKELIRFFDKSELNELELELDDARIYMSKGLGGETSVNGQPMMPYMPPYMAQYAPQPVPNTAPGQAALADNTAKEPAAIKGKTIESPMIGTYYESSSPGSAPFVTVGEVVEKGQTLCIIEAMKIMNTIEAEYRCKIIDMVASDGKPVEYGQALFIVEPQ